MIVPDLITPIDFDKNTNEFIFILENYILRINYEDKLFELQTPNQLAYNESFEFIKSPPEWFETIDCGLVEWIRKALEWNKNKSQPQDVTKPFSFKTEGKIYTGVFNPKTNDLSLNIPGMTIISKRDAITTDFPALQYTDHGQLLTTISNIIVGNVLKLETKEPPSKELVPPIVFNTQPIVICGNTYEFDYLSEFDIILLKMPDRTIQTNMHNIEIEALELAEMHQGMLIDVIRDVVYNYSN